MRARVVRMAIFVFVASCGGDNDTVAGHDADAQASEPGKLIAGDMSGDWDGESFQPEYGVAIDVQDGSAGLVLSTAPIVCPGDQYRETPGIYTPYHVLSLVPSHSLATHSFIRVNETLDEEEHTFPNGELEIFSVTDSSVVGSVNLGGSDLYQEHSYSLTGTFEMGRCPN